MRIKQSKSFLVCALFLVCGAAVAFADAAVSEAVATAPATAAAHVAADSPAVVATASPAADCSAASPFAGNVITDAQRSADASFGTGFSGNCSGGGCAGGPVSADCTPIGGPAKSCQAAGVCIGNPSMIRCRCLEDPIR